jgi:TPR repeat protein
MNKSETPGIILGFFACIAIGVLIFALDFGEKVINVAQYTAAYDIVRGNTDRGYTGKAIHWLRGAFGIHEQQPPDPALPLSAKIENKSPSLSDLKVAAKRGDAKAAYTLGGAYHTGQGVPKDDIEAAKWFRLAADQGDIKAQSALGFAYEFGLGVSKDYAAAIKWLRLAAEQGDIAAQYNLAEAYHQGWGVTKDDGEAVKWWREPATKGQALSQTLLGQAYHQGWGVPKDDAEAIKWYRKAADQGEHIAQSRLGSSYFLGWGVPKDFISAYMWLNLAAASGNDDAAQLRDDVTRMMLPDQIAEAQRLSREWKPKHSEAPGQ